MRASTPRAPCSGHSPPADVSRRCPATILLGAIFVLSGCATNVLPPTPTPLPSSAEATPSTTPERPTPTPPSPSPSRTYDPSLHVDGLASVTKDGLRRWVDPADKRANDKLDHPFERLEQGSTVLLVDGPRTVDGVDYWQVYSSHYLDHAPLGWAAASDVDGGPNLVPYRPSCPTGEPTARDLADAAGVDRLAVLDCFGGREIILQGTVRCQRLQADGVLAAPFFSSNAWCQLDQRLTLEGQAAFDLLGPQLDSQFVSGSYEIHGHFDDPESRYCYWTPFGTSLEGRQDPGDPSAIVECRLFYVVTSATPLT